MEANETSVGKRRMRSKQERRQIVEETFLAGASVARVARARGVNANQVFNWRKLYRTGRLEVESPSGALIPVEIGGPVDKGRHRSGKAVPARACGTIDIDLGHARVRIEGGADPACVRAALEGLAR